MKEKRPERPIADILVTDQRKKKVFFIYKKTTHKFSDPFVFRIVSLMIQKET